MNTLENISQAINNRLQFENRTSNIIKYKLPPTTIANYYTKTAAQHMFLNLIVNTPSSLGTLTETANALADDASYATTFQNQLSLRAGISIFSSTTSTVATDENINHKFSK